MAQLHLRASYPNSLCPHSDRRQYFAGYGTVGNIDVVCDDTNRSIDVISQHERKQDEVLCALKPSLPLLPPNKVADVHVKEEPCLYRIKRLRERMKYMLRDYTRSKGLVSNVLSQLDKDKVQTLLSDLVAYQEERLSKLDNLADPSLEVEMEQDDPLDAPNRVPRVGSVTDILKKYGDTGKEYPELFNSKFSGGCLVHLRSCNIQDYLFYPTGPEMSLLTIHPLVENNHGYTLGDQELSSNLYDRILEIDCIYIKGQGFCVIRCSRKVVRFQCQSPGVGGASWLVCNEIEFEHEEKPSSVSLSPYLAGEVCIATTSGNVMIWHANGTHTVVCRELVTRFSEETWWQCHYGSHPRAFIVSDRTGSTAYDLRRPGDHPSYAVDVFILPHRSLHSMERVMVTKRHPSQHFYHFIALQFSLVLVDERISNHPILFWTHLLVSPPQYISISESVLPGEQDVILLGSQGNNETVAFQFKLKGDAPPKSTSAPWKVSLTDDFLRLMTKQNAGPGRQIVSQRLCVPLAGVCGVPHHSGYGVSVFQMTVHGDLYGQDYESVTSRTVRDKTLSAGPGSVDVKLGEADLEYCKKWITELIEQLQDIRCASPTVAGRRDATTTLYAMASQAYPHVLCSLCMPDTMSGIRRQSESESTADTDTCQACGCTIEEGSALQSAIKLDSVVANTEAREIPAENILNDLDTSVHDDAMSQIMLKLWDGETDDLTDLLKQLELERKEKKEARTISPTDTVPIPDTAASPAVAEHDESIASPPSTPYLIPADIDTPDTSMAVSPDSPSKSSTTHRPLTTEGEFALPMYSPKRAKRKSGSIHSGSSGFSTISQNAGFLVTPPRVRRSSGVRRAASPMTLLSSPLMPRPSTLVSSEETFLSFVQNRSPTKQIRPKSSKKKRKLVEGF